MAKHEMKIKKGEKRSWIHLVDGSDIDIVVDIEVAEHASFSYVVIFTNAGYQEISYSLSCTLQGDYAHAYLNGVYALHGTQKVTITTKQIHRATDTTSSLSFKGLVGDAAHVHYKGTITIPEEGVRSVASQVNKNLLLSNTARAISQPELQVIQHDVQCVHGTAISYLDADQLLYMQSRGVPDEVARHLLLKAFLQEPLSCLTQEEKEIYLASLLEKVLL